MGKLIHTGPAIYERETLSPVGGEVPDDEEQGEEPASEPESEDEEGTE